MERPQLNPGELADSSGVERFIRQFTTTIEARDLPNRFGKYLRADLVNLCLKPRSPN